LTVAAYSALSLTSLTTIIITAPRPTVKILAARRLFFGGGSAGRFRLVAAAPASG